MPSVLLDTNVFSYILKGDSRATSYEHLLVGKLLYLSFQTVAELYLWAESRGWGAKRRQRLERALDAYLILLPDMPTAQLWASLSAHRQRLGLPISPQDAWVAACAMRHNLPLVTHNPKDFAEIEGLTLLTAL